MKPKRQEDSSCVFAYYFVAALATSAIPQKKKERRNHFSADQEKEVMKKPLGRYGRKIVKGEASSRPVCRSQSAAPAIRGIAYSQIRRRADHRTPAEFRRRVQRPGVRHRSIGAGHVCLMWQCTDLAQVKRDRHTDRPRKARSIKAFRLRQSILLRKCAGNDAPCQRVKCARLNTTMITRKFLYMTTKGIYHTLVTQLDKLARHNRQGSFRTKDRYYEAVKRFCAYLLSTTICKSWRTSAASIW